MCSSFPSLIFTHTYFPSYSLFGLIHFFFSCLNFLSWMLSLFLCTLSFWRLSGKEPACQWRTCRFDPRVRKIPCRRKWQHISVGKLLLPGKSHGSRSLVGYSLWGHRRVGHDWATKQQHFPYISSKATGSPCYCFSSLYPISCDEYFHDHLVLNIY